jgi:molybdopterin molybdotransferase
MAKALDLLQARDRVLAAAAVLDGTETVALSAARGRALAADVRTTGPWPATDRSAMDGFALATAGAGATAGVELPVVGESLAGRPFDRDLRPGEAIRIMTGAVVPAGADTVVPVEQTSGFGGVAVRIAAAVRAGANIRRQGSECAADAVVLAAGSLVRAAEIGVLAVLGHAAVQVRCRPRVGIVATGDEVVPIDAVPLPHQVRESNSWALAAQVEECGGAPTRLGVAPDEADALRALLQRGLADSDVLVTIGGISKGTHDLVHGTLQDLGVRTEFHGLDLKPGKPTYFGVVDGPDGRRRWVFGLPGNPASSFTVFDLLVRPLLFALQGRDAGAWSAQAVAGGVPWQPNSRLQAIPARLRLDGEGRAVADLSAPSPSGDPFRLVDGDGYVLVAGQQLPAAGARVRYVGGSAGVRLP